MLICFERDEVDSEFVRSSESWLSPINSIGRVTGYVSDIKNILIQRPSCMVFVSDMYSASVDDSVRVRCFRDDQETRAPERKKAEPETLIRSVSSEA